ncbi:hypothetical protein H5410_050958 [Solanum commersonii]|uniref:Uncharacterized protein n=1 Tax=Solanum commersonii TaxID=4109 RepID=A0A9J5WX06_SOLCO|nr:hypothetical protein H5410_050958 [Solanum commersonii]
MAKVKVQVDLTKSRPRHVWIGLDDEDLTIGRWQPIEYESIPPYCVYCKHQGPQEKKRVRSRNGKPEARGQGQLGQDHRQVRTKGQEEQQHQNTKGGTNQQSPGQQQEEEWQVSRRKNNKSHEETTLKTVWRPTSPQNKGTKDHPFLTAQQTGTNTISNNNSFTNLNLQEKQDEGIQEQTNNARTTSQGPQGRSKTDHNKTVQTNQIGNQANKKCTGIDSMLPIPTCPNNFYLDGLAEVEGGLDGGCQERHTKLQEGASKGGNLTHVQQQEQPEAGKQVDTGKTKGKQQREVTSAGRQNKGSMAKDMGANASTSNQGNTPKSKNKPSKKKREAAKKRQIIQQQNRDQQETPPKEGETCKKFIMVDDHLGMDITPLRTQYMGSPINVPPDKRPGNCQMNNDPLIDEYAVNNSEDELDVENQSLRDLDEDDETNKSFADEVHQVAKKQGLSPRAIHHDKFQFKHQDTNTVTAGRPNIGLFTSKSSQ